MPAQPILFFRCKLPVVTIVCGLLTLADPLLGAPIKAHVITGKEPGSTIRVLVGRTEREKACGIDDQLAGYELAKGRLVIETYCEGELLVSRDFREGDKADCEVKLIWPEPVPDVGSGDGKARDQVPAVAATDPSRLLPLLKSAIGDSLPEESIKLLEITRLAATESGTKQRIEIRFPSPRTGVSKARQFRIARRLLAHLLEGFGMAKPASGVWPVGFPSSPVVCNYDAEGVGYYGSTLLEQAVDQTTLDIRVVSVCAEDIREGALEKAVGVMFPGGSGRVIANALKPEGVDLLKKFVGEGHGYYGVCAGAYLAASGLDLYSGMIPIKHHQPWAKGKSMVRVELTAAGKALLGDEFSIIETRYNCGPVFTDLDANQAGGSDRPIQVLGRFTSAATDAKGTTHHEMIGTPALLATSWKNGKVLIVSPHPESHPQYHVLVARCIGWTLGRDPTGVRVRQK